MSSKPSSESINSLHNLSRPNGRGSGAFGHDPFGKSHFHFVFSRLEPESVAINQSQFRNDPQQKQKLQLKMNQQT
jgi:hypothetical protein